MWEKRKKLYYVPGLISAIILPIVFICKTPKLKQQVAFEFYLPSDKVYQRYSSVNLIRESKKKKILEIALDNNHEQNQKKLELIRHEARKIKYYNDVSTVIKVSFSNESTYGEVVGLLNIMISDEHKWYGLIGNDFYIFNEVPSHFQ